MTRNVLAPALIALAALAAVPFTGILSPAEAQPSATTGTPAIVAVIDLDKVIQKLTEAENERNRLKSDDARRQADLDEINKKVKEVEKRLETMAKDDPTRSRAQEELITLGVQGKARKEALERDADAAYGSVMLGLYMKVDDAVKRYAQQNGIDVVMAYEEFVPPPEGRNVSMGAVKRMSTERKVLFVADRVNITDAVSTMMNNEYAAKASTAAQPKPAQPKASPKANRK